MQYTRVYEEDKNFFFLATLDKQSTSLTPPPPVRKAKFPASGSSVKALLKFYLFIHQRIAFLVHELFVKKKGIMSIKIYEKCVE